MKIFKWISDNIFYIYTLFLLAFIPLYPKLPLLDVKNTWVYIRAEDFAVVFILVVWVFYLLRGKITLKSPLTLPIILFWIIGGISTIHAVLLIFPSLANVFPNVAFLSFIRRVEYLSLFFIAYVGIKEKKHLLYVIGVLTITLYLVAGYGFGQKYLGFNAYLTMNEEFAKGIPIKLSSLSRVPSTFAGHYDLAAYLVFIIPILTSLFFGFRKWSIKFFLLGSIFLGIILLFMTVSRVSFFVLLISVGGVLLFQKKRLVVLSLPFIIIILALLFLRFSPSLLNRFGNTVKEIDVLVNAKTGEAIGHVKTVPAEYFKSKHLTSRVFISNDQLKSRTINTDEEKTLASPSSNLKTSFVPVPPQAILYIPQNASTGENLPQGTGYINLSLSPVTRKVEEFFVEKTIEGTSTTSGEVITFYGSFLVKRVSAYDLSFTTRFQGEWPKTLEAFRRNVIFGSGYSSVSLAVDNNYLRILGEIGILGFTSFLAIFLIVGIYIKKVLPEIDSPIAKSFVVGFACGTIGLALNAVLIDVFEASKIAFLLWLLTGVTLKIINLYQQKTIHLQTEIRNAITSPIAIIFYLFVTTIVLFSPMLSNYFVGDDFTWFRWVADCGNNSISHSCSVNINTILHYFTQANGFFYRPGTKIYFLLMYSFFWLNQTVYHLLSLLLHFTVATLLFLIAQKIFKDKKLSTLASFLFLILSGYSEAVFWVSSTGFLFNAVFTLLTLLTFMIWEEKKKKVLLIISLVSLVFTLLFHELGIVTPLFIVLYKCIADRSFSLRKIVTASPYKFFFIPIIPYLFLRFFAQSHWFNGDYSYNVLKIPFNTLGNAIGYLFLTLFGPVSLPFYHIIRNLSKAHIVISIFITVAAVYVFKKVYTFVVQKIETKDRNVVVFSSVFFIIALLPFLGLGNISSRYSYLTSVGIVCLFVYSLNRLYNYLLKNGKDIAIACITCVITIFALFHLMQLQQIHSDWYEAGEKAKRFFIAIDELYADYWTKEPMKFYFVNVPLRVGQAWVFPVGLQDALWFSFRNPNIQVYQVSSVTEALNMAKVSKNEKIFIFENDGTITEKKKTILVQ